MNICSTRYAQIELFGERNEFLVRNAVYFPFPMKPPDLTLLFSNASLVSPPSSRIVYSIQLLPRTDLTFLILINYDPHLGKFPSHHDQDGLILSVVQFLSRVSCSPPTLHYLCTLCYRSGLEGLSLRLLSPYFSTF